MDSRKLYELLLVVFTLHFVRSNQDSSASGQIKTECLRTIQSDSRYLIKPHVEKYGSCAKIGNKDKRAHLECIFKWTLNGNCWQLQEIQQKIRESSNKCAYKPPRKYPKNCSRTSFMKCWCGFLSKDLRNL